MAISDNQKTDFLWKKVIYGVTNTSAVGGKQGYEETIGSPQAVFSNSIMAENVPTPAPNATGSVVQYFGKSNALRMTADPTVAGNRAWLATETFNSLSSRLTNWVPPSIDPGYLVEVYKNDPTVAGNKLLAGVNNQEWVFDYQAGVLNFVNNVPAGITSLWLVAHRYIGKTGLGGAGVNITESVQTYEGNDVTSGSYTFLNFFAHEPQAGTVTVEFNGQRMETNQWSVNGRNLDVIVDQLPFALEAGDIVSARYAWAG